MKKLLYIEDDEIDVLSLKRLLRNFENIEMEVITCMEDLKGLRFDRYDVILSDSNLPDASYLELKILLPNRTQFISGSTIDGESILLKPITEEQLKLTLSKGSLDLTYIKQLADGDKEYEVDMIETALRILPERWTSILEVKDDFIALRMAVHKTKSSFRVCGINNEYLTLIEELTENAFMNKETVNGLLDSVQNQIERALKELSFLLD